MAKYMHILLAETPVENKRAKGGKQNFTRVQYLEFPLRNQDDQETSDESFEETFEEPFEEPFEESFENPFDPFVDPIPLSDPKVETGNEIVPAGKQSCPMPDSPISILSQTLNINFLEDENIRSWESSQKEPLVEIPMKRTKEYFAIVQEMEEYSEKRAAKALGAVKTMGEKEEGIKIYERLLAGLRSLGGRERYQGVLPWERKYSKAERKRIRLAKLEKKHANRRRQKRTAATTQSTTRSLNPAQSFRVTHSTDAETTGQVVSLENRKERVIWRFEDVTWVKQRRSRPRKRSYVGTLDESA